MQLTVNVYCGWPTIDRTAGWQSSAIDSVSIDDDSTDDYYPLTDDSTDDYYYPTDDSTTDDYYYSPDDSDGEKAVGGTARTPEAPHACRVGECCPDLVVSSAAGDAFFSCAAYFP